MQIEEVKQLISILNEPIDKLTKGLDETLTSNNEAVRSMKQSLVEMQHTVKELNDGIKNIDNSFKRWQVAFAAEGVGLDEVLLGFHKLRVKITRKIDIVKIVFKVGMWVLGIFAVLGGAYGFLKLIGVFK